jgi:hypothetical protein
MISVRNPTRRRFALIVRSTVKITVAPRAATNGIFTVTGDVDIM